MENMKEFKGTHGPWKYVNQAHSTKPSGLGQRYAVKAGDKWVYNIALDKTEDLDKHREVDANAHIIAAAPDLLEALQKAVNDYGNHGGPWNVPSEPGTWIAMAKEAIDKALNLSQS